MNYDFVVVGAGLFGSVFANKAHNDGKKVLVVEKRNHIGGNCYTEKQYGIDIHKYGPHIFHTNNTYVWEYINQFTTFNNYIHKCKVNFNNKLFSFPINLFTLYQLWGVTNPQEAKYKLESVQLKIQNPQNLEEIALNALGEEIYNIFIYGYTKKQWGLEPNKLPSSIFKRLPIRLSFDDNYFNAIYQGIPSDGYTSIFEKLLHNIEVITDVDFITQKSYFENISNQIVYTGSVDELLDYKFGPLEYRSLRFENEIYRGDFQGGSIINYTSLDVPYTRIIEHKYFNFKTVDQTIITKEFSVPYNNTMIPYYPINDQTNNFLYNKYANEINQKSKYILGGRLGQYRYYDMDQTIAAALKTYKMI
jgi:UDP-galactopyranose mutase